MRTDVKLLLSLLPTAVSMNYFVTIQTPKHPVHSSDYLLSFHWGYISSNYYLFLLRVEEEFKLDDEKSTDLIRKTIILFYLLSVNLLFGCFLVYLKPGFGAH